MRILFVINGTDFGGTEVSLAQTAASLARRGHAVHVLSLKPVGPLGARMAAAGVAVSSFDMPEAVSPASLLQAAVRLARRLRREPYDVVHSLLPRANVVSRVANRLAGGGRPHFAGERSTDFRRARAVQVLNRLTAGWSDAVLAVSPAVRDVLIARDGIAARRILVVPNGIDLREIDRVEPADVRGERGIPAGHPIVCSIGRLIPDKGHVYLLRAVAALAARPAPAHVVLVGGGPEEGRLRDEAERLGIGPRVHCLGVRGDAAAVLKASDVFVLPSLEEGFPVSLLEAMACARPVVASAVGGIPAVLADGATGLLVPPGELWGADARTADAAQAERAVAALGVAIAALLDDPARARALGAAARKTVEESHSLDRVVSMLERLYAGRRADPGIAPAVASAGIG
jgi:glycosyltransferase involved in cell wall biosynthesis